jgi:ubiquinone/menaquinone biosynthesis C-methylase UbiE
MHTDKEYFDTLAAAYVRGKLQQSHTHETYQTLFVQPLEELSKGELQALLQLGFDNGLRLHRFKRTMKLPRVHKVLGILKGIQPQQLLDIGSGRGVFLWPLLNDFPDLPVTTIDILTHRVDDMQTVHDGGIQQLTATRGDVTDMPFADHSFDVVTMLEVLEHIPNTQRALAEICRVASRFIVLSVPSKEDNNPEHIHLFDQQSIKDALKEHGITRVTSDYVLNHLIIVARIERS